MKTQDVKMYKSYYYKDEIVTIVERISGKVTNKPNMQSGQMFTGYKREQKKFLLNNGKIVRAQELREITV